MDDSVDVLHQRAQRLLRNGEYRALAACCKSILRQKEDFADAWFLLSVVAEASGDLSLAEKLRFKAVVLDADNPEYLAQQARLLSQLNRSGAALSVARRALKAGPLNALGFDTLGVVFSRHSQFQEAHEACCSAVRLSPENAQYRFNLATVEQFLGNDAAAEEHYRSAINTRPTYARAWWALSELRKTRIPSDDLENLEAQALRGDVSKEDALYLGHAIAREYELRGQYESTFYALARGKAGFKDRAVAAQQRNKALFDAMSKSFGVPDRELRTRRAESGTPLFIVGMPRSGTTLVERMLVCHNDVVSLGEVPDFEHALKRSAALNCRGLLDAQAIGPALAESEHVAEDYLRETRARLEEGGRMRRYVLDKTPLNALYIGFILRSVPDARIVLLRRDARDTCLGNYRQLFALDYCHYDYQYDLEATACFIAGFEKLMSHWIDLYGDRVHCLHYEELVDEPETTLRKLLAYLELPWEPECLQFHMNPDGVTTPSALQVRRPVYQDAVGRWRLCQRELAPALAVFAGSGLLA